MASLLGIFRDSVLSRNVRLSLVVIVGQSLRVPCGDGVHSAQHQLKSLDLLQADCQLVVRILCLRLLFFDTLSLRLQRGTVFLLALFEFLCRKPLHRCYFLFALDQF